MHVTSGYSNIDSEISYDFGNHNLIPVLTITKQNFASGVQSPGNSVKFEITIMATQSAAENVTVTDLLPDGFHFDSGSWKVVSSDTLRGTNGDITSSLTAPTYHSPGTYTISENNVPYDYNFMSCSATSNGTSTANGETVTVGSGENIVVT